MKKKETMQEEENLKGKTKQTIISSIRKIRESKLHGRSKIRMLHKRRAENRWEQGQTRAGGPCSNSAFGRFSTEMKMI